MKRSIILSLLSVIISLSVYDKDSTIVRGNLEYITPSLVSNISPEYEEYKSSFKLDNCILDIDTKFHSFFWNANGEVYSLIKEIFPEDIIYDKEGNFAIKYIACYFQPQTGNIAIREISFRKNVYTLNIDNYINKFYNEFSNRIKYPILDLPMLEKSSSFFSILKPGLIDEKIKKEERAKAIE